MLNTTLLERQKPLEGCKVSMGGRTTALWQDLQSHLASRFPQS